MWRCPVCHELHDWEDDAAECCADEEEVLGDGRETICPVCRTNYSEHRDAADCCLWKDLDQQTRHRIADAVEAGSTWKKELLQKD